MSILRPRTFVSIAAAAISAVVPVSRSLAVTYTWAGPFTGTGTANPWSNASSWVGNQIPVSSSTTQLVFSNFDANAYSATNNLSSPSFAFNNLTVQNGAQGGNVTINSLNASSGTYQLQTAGVLPTINLSGPSSISVGGLTSGSGYGLFLNPSSGTTTINDSGNGIISIGSTTSGINGSGGLTINSTGLGIINLSSPTSGSTNSYTGNVTLNSGSLQVNSTLSLGAAGNSLIINGGNLRSGSATFANPIIANSDLVVFSGSPTIQGVISGNGGLQLASGAEFSSTKVTLTNVETYTGATTINPGPLRTSASNLASLTIGPSAVLQNTSAINVGQSGTLTFTAGATNSALPSAAPISLNGAFVSLLGNASTTAETLGSVAGSSMTTLSYTPVSGTATNTLNLGSFTANDHGTLFLRGNWQGSGVSGSTFGVANFSSGITTVADSNAPAGSAPVVPFAAGASSATALNYTAFVTSGAPGTTGLSLLPISGPGVVQYSSLANGLADLPANDVYLNVNSVTTVNVNGTQQVYALSVAPVTVPFSGIATFSGSGTLNIASGVIIASSGITKLAGPTINFGTNTGYIHLSYAGSSLTVNDTASQIIGSGGLVISGPTGGAVVQSLQFSDSGTSTDSSNPFTGGLTVNGGATVNYTNDLQLGAAGQPITLNGGMLNYNPSANPTVIMSRPLRLGVSGGGISGINSNSVTVSSLITGPGAFYLSTGATNTGTTALTNSANSYAGGTYIYNGTLNVNSDGVLGLAGTPVVLAGGNLQFGSPTTLNRPITIRATGSSIDTNGFSSSISGAFSSISSTAGFNKTGAGTLSLTAASPQLSGALNVNAGVLELSGNGSLPQVPNVIVSNGGTFKFNNSTTNLSNRYSTLGRVTLAGGTLDLTGNASAASSQTIGGINLPGTVNVSNSTVSVSPSNAVLTASGPLISGASYASVNAFATSSISSYTPTSVTGVPQSLTKIGSGTLALTNANTFATNNPAGGVLIAEGTVKTSSNTSLGFGASVPATLSGEATVGSTSVASGAALDLGGTSLTEPVTLNGGSLLNSSATPATFTSGIKAVSFNSTTTSVNYTGGAGQTVGISGSGYLPTDTITYTGGSGASASLVLGLTSASFNILNGGNYSTASSGPNVAVSSSNGEGSGATVVPITDANNNLVGVYVTNPGSGYTAPPILTVTGVGQTADAVVAGTSTGFGVVGIKQTSAGTGYSSSSTSVVNTTGGSGLSLNSPVVSSIALQSTSSIGGSGDITVSAIVSGSGGLAKVGSDTVTLSASNTFSGGTNISAGVLSIPVAAGLSAGSVQLTGGTLGLVGSEVVSNAVTAVSGSSGISVAVSSGATTASLTGGLTIQSGATVNLSATGSGANSKFVLIPSSFSDNGTLNIKNNALDLSGVTLSAINTLVKQGYNSAATIWNGTGISSSTAATDSTHLTAVGVILNDNGSGTRLYGPGGGIASTFGGAAASLGDVLVKYTYYGDANLDGVVNGSDYSRIDNGYLTHLTGWYNGDFNYDGIVNGSDYTLMDNAYNTQAASLAAAIASPSAIATSQIAGPAASVPEPALLSLIGIGAIGLLGRRPRR